MIAPVRKDVEQVVKSKGYKYYENGQYNLNIVGIRSDDNQSNKFNDWVCVSYKDSKDKWVNKKYRATTDPGLFWREHPINRIGAAILKPGQYEGAYTIGLHQGRYKALVQRGAEVTVKRDNDKDSELDFEVEKEQTGYFGINIHRAFQNKKAYFVNKWSAGCQVLGNNTDYNEFLELADKARKKWGNSFTYTLLEEKDFN